jgi:preprotein translocase subunit Sec61beta
MAKSNRSSSPLQVIRRPVGTEHANHLDQRLVVGIGIIVFKRAGLIQYLMGGKARRLIVRNRLRDRCNHRLSPYARRPIVVSAGLLRRFTDKGADALLFRNVFNL